MELAHTDQQELTGGGFTSKLQGGVFFDQSRQRTEDLVLVALGAGFNGIGDYALRKFQGPESDPVLFGGQNVARVDVF